MCDHNSPDNIASVRVQDSLAERNVRYCFWIKGEMCICNSLTAVHCRLDVYSIAAHLMCNMLMHYTCLILCSVKGPADTVVHHRQYDTSATSLFVLQAC